MLLGELATALRGLKVHAPRVEEYAPCELLFLYGWGGQVQQAAVAAHKGNYIAFDLGYWNRGGIWQRKWRMSVNGFHCPEEIMKGSLPSDYRLRRDKLVISQGHAPGRVSRVLLIGNAPKSVKVIEAGWTAKRAVELKAAFPKAELIYRPKPGRPQESGVRFDSLSTKDLAAELTPGTLVVCRHSNVAVDACIAGIPVVCDDGAAAAIYPSDIHKFDDQPDRDLRREFLIRLAWWQWSIREIKTSPNEFWRWTQTVLKRASA